MNEEPYSENITPQELIDSLLHNIELCKETSFISRFREYHPSALGIE
jgi:hypothetical protein